MSFERRSPTEERKSLLTGFDAGEKERDLTVSDKKRRTFTFNLFAVLVCLLCTSINIHAFRSAGKQQIRRYYDMGKLRRPSPFVGLDRVQLGDKTPEPILIYPNHLQIINKGEPSRAYSDDPARLLEIGGLVPPADRQFKVTPEISTIVEFRSVDYKMEDCELTVATPPASATNVTLGLGNNVVDIWKIPSKFPINGKLLTWATRPNRVSKVASITMTHGMTYTHHFHCPADTLHAFEFAAGGDSTYVDWVQDHYKPTPGAQHSSFSLVLRQVPDLINAFLQGSL
ncbi:hypothetical protein EIP91_004442 [Steccherinum ochraceum]|uniref:Ubiquitin 3 binding protein But2 C-terminal domain-containing protein n=1 Tax=Steccherinum ochraceum TaxID=92696 RepID=A0A4R0RK91_9APHY|nr:hypothetical protein EIP91_004442 [Steccherinum ochraceum]